MDYSFLAGTGVKVSIEDSSGVVVANSTDSVTIAIGNNAGSGTLSGTLTAAAVNGVATFSNLSIDKAGTGYTLAATDSLLANPTTTSGAFNITAAGANKLAFGVQPSNTNGGATITPAVTAARKGTSSTAFKRSRVTSISGRPDPDSARKPPGSSRKTSRPARSV